MSGDITPPGGAIEIRIANVSFPAKLDAIAAALEAVKQAHKEEISDRGWKEIGRAQEFLSAAMLCWARVDDPNNPWRSMDSAPKNATWCEVKIEKTQKVYRAHWAEGGGEEQPYFIGWFEPVLREDGSTSYYSEVPEPYAWRPIKS